MPSPLPRRFRRTAALTAVLALGATAVTAASAAPPTTPGPATDPAPSGRSAKVTLVTGDVVEVSDAGSGRKAATVHPAPGRERITFHTVEVDGGLRVLPSDVVPYVSTGVLDADLFDVDELIADGFGDAATPSLPLIVRYTDPSVSRARPLPGTTTTRSLGSIGGAAVRATKSGLPGLWKSLDPSPVTRSATALGAGVAKVWLDGRVRSTLDHSVPQIGAPAAWQAGYEGTGVKVAVLDSGVDATHPDLVGKIKEAQDFSGSPGVEDHYGHGTHVAATIAGTGAGSGGLRKGVAPKADLLIGKVLDDAGTGYESSIIAGMEWATAEGASVVNLSLGGEPTDGTDPLSQAVDRLTAETGALFVVAAGNDAAEGTVGTPGAASSALTVGAVDSDDALAPFSSQGPRLGDDSVKPEITAPGVGIVAARAAGTWMGEPVDDLYTAASGTSMATPHVAGAAALLAQAHPDWKADRLKDALVSTAETNLALGVFAQGGGRADVGRAITQHVDATGVADFGPQTTDKASTRTITYRNDGPAPVTLDLAVAKFDNLDTQQPAPAALTVPGTVTVPAGGSVDVPVVLDPTKLDHGLHGGWVVATGPNGVVIHTAVGALRRGPKHTVTFHVIGADGGPAGVPAVSLYGAYSRSDVLTYIPPGGVRQVAVEEGTYLLHALVESSDPQDEKVSLVADPNVHVTADTEFVIDARKAAPITIRTPKPSEQQSVLSFYVNRAFGTGRTISHGVMQFSTVKEVRVTPTKPVTDGSFEFSSRWQLVAPMVQSEVPGVPGPLNLNLLHQSPAYDGKKRFPLVYAADSSASELRNVRGAVVVMPSAIIADSADEEPAQLAAAAQAGAAGAILIRPADFSAWTVWTPEGDRDPILGLATTVKDGEKLAARARQGDATIDLTLTTSSPYLYEVQQVSPGYVPDHIVHTVTPENSARVTTRYADNGGFGWAKEQRFAWRPWQSYSWNDGQRVVRTPSVREEWVSAGDSLWQHRVDHRFAFGEPDISLGTGMSDVARTYQPSASAETWFGPVVRPATPKGVAALQSTRTADRLSFRVPEFVDADGHFSIGDADHTSSKVWRDGELVADLPDDAPRDVTTSRADAAYRLELNSERGGAEWAWATQTRTVWDFRSAGADKVTALPLLQVDYDVPVDLTGRVAGPHKLGFTVRQQDGVAAPTSTSLQAEVSFDEGSTWRRVTAVGAHGTYMATVPAAKGESVSLRVKAADGAGNKVEQTVIRAYGLS